MSQFDDLLLNSGLYEDMYQRYLQDPGSVDKTWKAIFAEMEKSPPQAIVKPMLMPPEHESEVLSKELSEARKIRLSRLIEAFRRYGHLKADINPLKKNDEDIAELDYKTYGFDEEDLSRVFPSMGLFHDKEVPLKDILARLQKVYTGTIGFEFKGFTDPKAEKWLEEEIETKLFADDLSIEKKQMILENLAKSELLETFIHTKYAGQKRFSLEGAETLIPILKEIIEEASNQGIDEFVIGMAHRGRLNVLSNILNKSYAEIFFEFDEGYVPARFEGTGDVKYHKGFYSEISSTEGKKVKITLLPNPSHLESVDPVVEGQTRAKQTFREGGRHKVLPILIHGDAAISGQGVVYETLQMQHLKGFSTGGTVHIVINNQIGFTTVPDQGRSTAYCTDIAKAFGNPVFHVNSEDPESCLRAAHLALKYRQEFHTDVFIDMYSYRKYGHNETDEPAFTQPELYKLIKEKKPVKDIYLKELLDSGAVEQYMAEAVIHEFKKALNEAKETLKLTDKEQKYTEYQEKRYEPPQVKTAVSEEALKLIAKKITDIPESVQAHPKIQALMNERFKMVSELERKIDWGMAELLAYGSLVNEGRPVRLTGQDSERGTFSHRHGTVVDQRTGEKYIPLNHISDKQAPFSLYNTILSEFASLGFEFGYSLSTPSGLTIWEAQFGDFVNGAQVVIDQYIASSEQKWGQISNLVLLLPHGYEGQGPEHSSGKMERFLSLAGHNNLRVCNPSTTAQNFHLLRRQALGTEAKPLIIFTPKKLLRDQEASSPLTEFTRGTFQEIIDDPDTNENLQILCFCSGKIYYELKAYAQKFKDDRAAFVRIEQLYPLHKDRLMEIKQKYENVKEIYWVQEEPKNMGAWSYIRPHLEQIFDRKINYNGRDESAAPATGHYVYHRKENGKIMEGIFSKDRPTTFEITGQIRA